MVVNSALTIHFNGEWIAISHISPETRALATVYSHRVEYSKSSRARCRKCSELVAKNVIRVGTPIKWHGAMYGYISSWTHLECTRLQDDYPDVDPAHFDASENVYGIGTLSAVDQVKVAEEFRKTGLPPHILSLSPDEPAFLQNRTYAPTATPKAINGNLLSYQAEGLSWMLEQEASPILGGILAFEMGMGKTLTMLSLIVEQRYRLRHGIIVPSTVMTPPQSDVGPTSSQGSTMALVAAKIEVIKNEVSKTDNDDLKSDNCVMDGKLPEAIPLLPSGSHIATDSTNFDASAELSQVLGDSDANINVKVENDTTASKPLTKSKGKSKAKVQASSTSSKRGSKAKGKDKAQNDGQNEEEKSVNDVGKRTPHTPAPTTSIDSDGVECVFGQRIEALSSFPVDRTRPPSGPTLVVAPTSAVLQWRDEINHFIKQNDPEHRMSVLVYYGERADISPTDIAQYDIVLTTYPVLESEYRRCLNATKVTCQFCQKKFVPRALVSHLAYFCGPDAKRTANLSKREKRQQEATIAKGLASLGVRSVVQDSTLPMVIDRSESEEESESEDEVSSRPPSSKRSKDKGSTRSTVTKGKIITSSAADGIESGEETASEFDSSSASETPSEELSLSSDSEAPNSTRGTQDKDVKRVSKPKISRDGKASRKTAVKSTRGKSSLTASSSSTSNRPRRASALAAMAFIELSSSETTENDGNDILVPVSANPPRARASLPRSQAPSRSRNRTLDEMLDDTDDETEDGASVREVPSQSRKVATTRRSRRLFGHEDDDEDNEDVIAVSRMAFNPASSESQHRHNEDSDMDESKEEVSDDTRNHNANEDDNEMIDKTPIEGIAASPSFSRSSAQLLSAIESGSAKRRPPTITNIYREFMEKSGRTPLSRFTKAPLPSQGVPVILSSSLPEERVHLADLPELQTQSLSLSAAGSAANAAFAAFSDDDDNHMDKAESTEQVYNLSQISATTSRQTRNRTVGFVSLKIEEDASTDAAAFVPSLTKRRSARKSEIDDVSTPIKPKATSGRSKAKKLADDDAHKSVDDSSDDGVPLKGKSKSKTSTKGKGKGKADSFSPDSDQKSARKGKPKRPEIPSWVDTMDAVLDDDGIDVTASALHSSQWGRLVLDEAHKIKARVSSTAKAVYALRASRRWGLSGTPLQNRIGELYAIVRFLRISPFAQYFCGFDGCDCSSFNWKFGRESKRCVDCNHPPMYHFSWFNRNVANPIKRYGHVGNGRLALLLLRDGILNKVMLRKTKVDCAKDLRLPPLTMKIRSVKMGAEERDFYEAIFMQSQIRFDAFISSGTLLHNYAHIFELLSRLRQAVDHPYLVIHGASANTVRATAAESAVYQEAIRDAEIRTVVDTTTTTTTTTTATTTGIVDAVPEKRKRVTKAKSKNENCEPDLDLGDDGEGEGNGEGEDEISLAQKATQCTVGSRLKQGLGDVCGVCYEDIDGIPSLSKCRHTFHRECITGHMNGEGLTENIPSHQCPVCFQPLTLALSIRGAGDIAEIGSLHDPSTSVTTTTTTAMNAAPTPVAALCSVCFDRPRDSVYIPCGHSHTCMECTRKMTTKACAVCRAKIEKVVPMTVTFSNDSSSITSGMTSSNTSVVAVAVGHRSILQKIDLSTFHSSAKVTAVLEETQLMCAADPRNKGIIFSQYSSMLDILEWTLRKAGIVCVKFVGSMPLAQRRSVLDAFRNDPAVRVVLMSLRAGGEGLNLQAASHVMILEPWWNPAVEDQAIQRSHRIGQTREVTAIRFVVEDSIENRMVELQEKKRLVFQGTIDSKAAAFAELSHEDLQFLFQN